MEIPVTKVQKWPIEIPIGDIKLSGELSIPEKALGLVIFSHGSGSSHLSPRNRMVAEKLQDQQMGTLLFDLLTEQEDAEYSNRFNIDLLTQRLIAATGWVMEQDEAERIPIGYFGASTGSAAALKAATRLSNIVKAVVSRGGRPDLVMETLPEVQSAVLLIVGRLDHEVLKVNQAAFEKINSVKKLEIMADATHLFEEPDKLEEVARLSANWFKKYLKK